MFNLLMHHQIALDLLKSFAKDDAFLSALDPEKEQFKTLLDN